MYCYLHWYKIYSRLQLNNIQGRKWRFPNALKLIGYGIKFIFLGSCVPWITNSLVTPFSRKQLFLLLKSGSTCQKTLNCVDFLCWLDADIWQRFILLQTPPKDWQSLHSRLGTPAGEVWASEIEHQEQDLMNSSCNFVSRGFAWFL